MDSSSSCSPSSSTTIEIRIMYCNDLKSFNFFQKLSVYVLASIASDDPNCDRELDPQQQRTHITTDSEGNGCLEWNHHRHEIRFHLKEHSPNYYLHPKLFIHFDIRHHLGNYGLFLGDKTIGEVRVPLQDLLTLQSSTTTVGAPLQFLSYQISTSDGKPNGVLNFSYRVLNHNNDNSLVVESNDFISDEFGMAAMVGENQYLTLLPEETHSSFPPATPYPPSPPHIYYPPPPPIPNVDQLEAFCGFCHSPPPPPPNSNWFLYPYPYPGGIP